ncbi:MAG: hypothetical protein IPJ23_17300 [Ignavibacteriales bacterium]|nr:hypothetical protein [Ignavibacteriales bacterium]
MIKTNNAIQELIGFLRFDDESYKDLAINLIKLISSARIRHEKEILNSYNNIIRTKR